MRALRGRLSGLCQPTYVLDIPGGHGKSPIGPNYLSRDGRRPLPGRGLQRSAALLSAADVIRTARALKPHPEGGHYRQTFRDPRNVDDGRAASTAIYFLLARGERSHWHRVDAVEIWHWYAGAPLELQINDGARNRWTCGSAPISQPASVRRRWCRRAPGRPPKASATGRLVGCTVAPGFEFGLRARAAGLDAGLNPVHRGVPVIGRPGAVRRLRRLRSGRTLSNAATGGFRAGDAA